MFNFTMNCSSTASRADREEAMSARPQHSELNIALIIIGISVLMSVFAVAGIIVKVNVCLISLLLAVLLAAVIIRKILYTPTELSLSGCN